jgi:hypothetical protein
MREIGSEFWLESEPSALSHDRNGIYVLSGRTAIDLIIQDIIKSKPVYKAYLPAWCCDSMVNPFLKRGIQVDFYDMSFDGNLHYYIDADTQTDIFYVSNYFGYKTTVDKEIILQFKEKGATIIHDRTHSFLMDDDIEADYTFASIRKWMGVVAGAVVNGVKDGQLKPYPYLGCKAQAMRMKKVFIEGDNSIDTQTFLNLYGEFGHHLMEDFQNYEMDDLSYALYKSEDLEAMRRKRRENAKFLHENLKGMRFIGELTDKAVPLFVPVFFDTTEQRNAIRKKLIEAQIYCPIHWPKPAQIPVDFEANRIYDTELSLICDQRYNIENMQRIVAVINEHDFK